MSKASIAPREVDRDVATGRVMAEVPRVLRLWPERLVNTLLVVILVKAYVGGSNYEKLYDVISTKQGRVNLLRHFLHIHSAVFFWGVGFVCTLNTNSRPSNMEIGS